jgi:hypothetical protein
LNTRDDQDQVDESELETNRLAPAQQGRNAYGKAPMGIVLTVVLGGPLAALVFLLTGHALDAVVIALVAFTFGALFAAEAREGLLHGVRVARRAAAIVFDRAAFAGSALSAWTSATVEIERLRARRRRLERRVVRLMQELGEAAYAGDYGSVQVARSRASAARTLIAQTDRVSEHVRSAARARIAARR